MSGASVDASADEVRGDVDRAGIYGAVGEVPREPPEARIERPRDGETFRAGDKVEFRGTGEDHEDGTLSGSALVWRSSRDGQLGTGERVERDDLSIGTHQITLTVTDSRDQTDTDRVDIEVRNTPPEAEIERPRDGETFRAGDRVEFRGTGEDREDGTLSGSALVWRSSRDGQLGTGERVERDDLSIGTHQITLTVTDSRGLKDTDRVDIEVRNTPPEAEIDEPEDGDVFVHGRSIRFEGEAKDREDGYLKGDALVWTSSIDGEFGRGEEVETDGMSEGEHVITLTATDSHGDEATDEIVIRVVRIF